MYTTYQYRDSTHFSSCWDGLLTFDKRLARLTCQYLWKFCAALSMQNGFTRRSMGLSGVAAGRAPHIHLYTNIVLSRSPSLACNQSPASATVEDTSVESAT
eukprot:6172747-Pleurochrysis_carterae.AAC.5